MKTIALLLVSLLLYSSSYCQRFFFNDLSEKQLNGRVKKVTERVYALSGDNTRGRCLSRSSESYNERGFVIEKSISGFPANLTNNRLVYKYDTNDNKIEEATYLHDTLYKTTNYLYDARGRLLQDIEYYAGSHEQIVHSYASGHSEMNCVPDDRLDRLMTRTNKSGYDKAGNWTVETGASQVTIREIEYY